MVYCRILHFSVPHGMSKVTGVKKKLWYPKPLLGHILHGITLLIIVELNRAVHQLLTQTINCFKAVKANASSFQNCTLDHKFRSAFRVIMKSKSKEKKKKHPKSHSRVAGISTVPNLEMAESRTRTHPKLDSGSTCLENSIVQ